MIGNYISVSSRGMSISQTPPRHPGRALHIIPDLRRGEHRALLRRPQQRHGEARRNKFTVARFDRQLRFFPTSRLSRVIDENCSLVWAGRRSVRAKIPRIRRLHTSEDQLLRETPPSKPALVMAMVRWISLECASGQKHRVN